MEKMGRIFQAIKNKGNLLVFVFLFPVFLAACGDDSNEGGKNIAEPAVVTGIVTSTPQPTPEPEIIVKEVTVIVTPSPPPEPTPTPTLPPELEGEGEGMPYLYSDYAGSMIYAWYEQDSSGSMVLSLMRVLWEDYDAAELMDKIYLKKIGENLYCSEDEYYFLYMEDDMTAFYFVDSYTRDNLSGHYICESRYYLQFLGEDD